jgi:hypothetical protein
MQPPSNSLSPPPTDTHVESYRTDNPRGNPPPAALAAWSYSRRPDPPGACPGVRCGLDPPPSPHQPDDLTLRAGKMHDPPSLQQQDVDSDSSVDLYSEEYSGHNYGYDDDKEEQGEGKNDTERYDDGVELWLSTSSLLSPLSAPSPLTLSASASLNCSMNHFAKSSSSWGDSRRTSMISIDSANKPLTFTLRGLMTGDDLEPVLRLNKEKTHQQQWKIVTAAADSFSSAARVGGGGEPILGGTRGHCEFTKSDSALLLPTTPASRTAAGTEALAQAASMLSRWRFSVEEEEKASENADSPDDGNKS